MTKEESIAMLKAKRECIELDTNGNAELCDRNCGNCKLNYEQGNMGEQKEALEMAIKALEQEEYYKNLAKSYAKTINKLTKAIAEQQSSEDCKIFGTKENCFGGATEKECNHCDYKIQALEQHSEDCVSRQAVLDLMQLKMGGKELYKAVYDMPPVTPTQRWIPVSEKLPEEETDVLICNANKEIAISRGSYSTEIENTFIWYTSGWRFGEVIAWQPLPKPYEEKRGREE